MNLTVDQIAARYQVKRRTVVDQWTKRPDFPRPVVNISRKVRAWKAEDVEQWAKGK